MHGDAGVRWERARELLQGAAVTVESLAELMGEPVDAVRAQLGREEGADELAPAPLERMRRLRTRLLRDMEMLEADEAPFDKARWDRVTAMARWLDKMIEDQKSEDEPEQPEAGHAGRTDAEIADMLRIIDIRIDELARRYAGELVAGGAGGTAG